MFGCVDVPFCFALYRVAVFVDLWAGAAFSQCFTLQQYNTSLQRSVPTLLHNTLLQNLSVFRKRRKFNARHKIHITKIAIINSSRSWRHNDDSRKSVVEECRIPSVGKEFHREVL